MDEKSGYGKHSSKEVTEVISRNIAAGHEKDYDDWLQRFMISERQFPGYLGTTIIAHGGNISCVRYVINRFAEGKFSTRQRVTGLETWFNLPNLKTIEAPPKWKMAIVSFIAAYSISLVAH